MKNKNYTIKPKIHILSNGELAEPQYFKDFKDHIEAHTVKIIHYKRFLGKAPWKFINEAVDYKINLSNSGDLVAENGDQVWCVFDIDSFYDQNSEAFKSAMALANGNGVFLAWSNECFELWFVAHFCSITNAIPRMDYHKKLKKSFKDKSLGKYEKNREKMFNLLLPFQNMAIKNAKKFLKSNEIEKNPSTSVYLLVEELNKLK